MLWEEMEKYTKLTGEDGAHVPIMKLGAYLDGYEKGTEVLDKIRDEIEQLPTAICTEIYRKNLSAKDFKKDVFKIIDKYKAEGSGEE